jgi:hypothetical protein
MPATSELAGARLAFDGGTFGELYRRVPSLYSEVIAAGEFDDATVGGHGSEPLVEWGGTNATGSAQFDEWPGWPLAASAAAMR